MRDHIKKLTSVLFPSLVILGLSFIHLSGESLSYNFEKGLCLNFNLDLETKIHFDQKKLDEFVTVRSLYFVKFYVLEMDPEGKSIIAATSHLEKTAIDKEDIVKNSRASRSINEWLDTFEKDDFAAFILDRWGNILRGRMVWPYATCYHLPKILEGLSLERKNKDSKRSNCFGVSHIFTRIEKQGDQEFLVSLFESNKLKLRLLFDVAKSLPSSLEARYGYCTLGSIFKEDFKMTLSRLHNLELESLFDEELMLAAVIQSSILLKRWSINPDAIRRALSSKNPRIRIVASRYIAGSGLLPGINLADEEQNKNEIVRYNLAKAEYLFNHDRTELEKITKHGSSDLKTRASELLLQKKEPSIMSTDRFIQVMKTYKLEPNQHKEKDIYESARAFILQKKDMLHFGGNSYKIASNSWSKRCFHYNVWIPEDYDPEEKYPLLIGLAGGNGFSESFFLTLRKVIPNHYIIVCPNADYGMWWESDRIQMFDILLKEIVKDYAVDQDRIYLSGFSNGGIAAYYYGYIHPDRFAAISSLMGYSRTPQDGRKVETEMSLNMINTPLLIIHGARDRVISISSDRTLADFLRRNNISHKFYEVKRAGHDITFHEYHKTILNYFRNYERNPAPTKINLIMDHPKFNRNFWIRVDEMADPSKRAKVKAEKKDNTFLIHAKNVKTLTLLLNDFHYDQDSEYEVVINKKKVFKGKLNLDPRTLLESVENEIDYARLYGVKLSFSLRG